MPHQSPQADLESGEALATVNAVSDENDLQQGFGMTADQRDALMDRFDKASRIAAAEPVAVVGIGCRFPGGVVGPERIGLS